MSDFFIRVETIDTVIHHPNADKLDIATLVEIGFQFVVGRDQYKVGDQVIYFPLDAIIPDALATELGLLGKLGGKAKNRVKTIKLRGEISQGLVGPKDELLGLTSGKAEVVAAWAKVEMERQQAEGTFDIDAPIDFASFFGITKYEPEEHLSGGPNNASMRMNPLPPEVSKYDIEGCQRYKAQLDTLMGTDVVITEKLEGSHCAVLRKASGELVYCSRNCTLLEPGTFYHKGVENSGILERLEALANIFDGHDLTVRGELIGPGIQGNIYRLKDYQFRLFEFEVDRRPIDAFHFYDLFDQYVYLAPVLWADGTLAEWLAHTGAKDVTQGSNGKSVLGDTLREGIVIKPCKEMSDRKLGRLFLKQRSPEYLATHDT